MKGKKSRVVKVTSVFPASKKEIFDRLQTFQMLKKIAKPYITFTAINGSEDLQWQEGQVFSFKAKLLGFIPFGIHTIKVIEFAYDTRIYTNEVNTFVPIWNHEIVLEELSEHETMYTDKVDIYAGWKTYFVYLWAKLFYKHRQKMWINILKTKE